MRKLNIKEVLTSCLLIALTPANAQPELTKIDKFFSNGDSNELIVFSDSDLPIKESTCRKLRSEITEGSRGLWSRYYFEDVPKDGQWYKDFVFMKITQPIPFFFNERKAFYDVVNRQYVTYSNIVDDIQYMKLRKDYFSEGQGPIEDYFFFPYKDDDIELQTYNTKLKTLEVCSTKLYDDGRVYIDFKPEGSKNIPPISIYKFNNADFINQDIPDQNINTKAKYLFLQRDYKLGQKYNTVIFPVDVPVYEYNHVYNNGKNRLIVYKLETIDSNSLNFIRDVSGVLKANTPYIIKSESNDNTTSDQIVSEYYLSETPVDHFDINCTKEIMNSNNIRVFAQYMQKVVQDKDGIQDDEDIYIVSDNKLVNCRNVQSTTVNRFRWYIKRPRTESATPMTMTFDGITEINSVECDPVQNTDVYNLSGMKVGKQSDINSLGGGFYIFNGKVVKL